MAHTSCSALCGRTLHCALELSKNSRLLAIQFPDREAFNGLLALVYRVPTKLSTSSLLQASKKNFVCATKSSGYWNSAP
jgi:hypothetical protein